MKYIFTLLLTIAFTYCCGQSSPQVNSVAGFDFTNHVDFYSTASIGEALISTLSEGNVIVTQGFLQPNRYSPCSEIKITFYPNPTVKEITVEAGGCEAEIVSLDFYDSWGHQLTSIPRPKNDKIDLGNFAPGMYFVQLNLTIGSPQLIKIIKLSN